MFSLPLAWTLLTVSLWTSGSCQILQQEALRVLYPEIHNAETIDCDCVNLKCDSVYWFRSISNNNKVEFLGKYNNADRANYADKDKEARFKLNRKGSASFTLRILNVTEEDTGIYSCVLKENNQEIWKPGVLLLPGGSPPTKPPEIKKPKNPGCSCKKKKPSPTPAGCVSLVLWSLVGLIAGLALAIICTLCYFSRLPKKCRHHVAKKR